MTTTEFQQQFPKPWRLVRANTCFSIKASNGQIVGYIMLQNRHSGIPQKEWNRHVGAAMSEYMQVTDEPRPQEFIAP